jgi:hypothetical protein
MRYSTIIIFISLLIQGCKKHSGNPTPPTNADVYVAGGYYNPNTGFGLKYWKNGIPTSLGDSSYLSVQCRGLAVSGEDIYVSANLSADTSSADQISEYWKNGVVTILPKGIGISNIVVSDGDIYLASTDSAGRVGYWVNDSVVLLSNGSSNRMNASCIFVSGQTVYVGGNEAFPNVGWHPVYWLNSMATTLPSPMGSDCWVAAIFVSNSNVYLCGYDNGNAAYWTNEGETLLASSVSVLSEANCIFISGNDIYVGGFDGNFAVYWKNGKEVELTNGVNYALVNGIFISGNDVYTAGVDNSRAVYWINGTRVALPDSTQVAWASAIVAQ